MSRTKHFRKDAVIYDLDGTLANTKEWEEHHKHRHEGFAKEAESAPEIKKNVKHLKKDEKKGEKIVILTARSEHYKKETDDWLKKHDIDADEVVMRPKDDSKTPDKVVKNRLLDEKVTPKYKVSKAYDDKKKNVKMFKKHGIKAKEV